MLRVPALMVLALAACHSGFRPVDAAADAVADASRAAESRAEGSASSGWELVYEDKSAQPTESLNALWVADAQHVFAVGDNRQLVSYDGSGWSGLNKTEGAHLYGVWGRSATDVTAVGLYAYNGSPAIFHYDGTTWAPQGPLPTQVKALSDLWGTGSQTYYVGKDGTIFQDDPVAHPNDRYHVAAVTGGCPQRSDPSPNLWAIDGSDLGNILVGGDRGLLSHFNLSDWTRLCHSDPAVNYRAVYRLPGSTDFMLGGNFLALYRFSGREQPVTVIHENRALKDADKLHLWSIWASSAASVIAVGDAGTILYWNGGAAGPRQLPSPTSDALFGVAGVDERQVYLCGQRNRIWRGRLPSD